MLGKESNRMSKTHKGDWHRLGDAPAYRNNYDAIFRKNKTHDPINTDTDDTGTRETTANPPVEDRGADSKPTNPHRGSEFRAEDFGAGRAPDPE